MTPIRLALAAALALLTACAPPEGPETPPPDLAAFRLGEVIVVGETAQPVGPSRQATPEEWEALIRAEVQRRLGGLAGERTIHLGISVDAYALAFPGVPVLLSPKSVLAVTVTAWDSRTMGKLNPEARTFTVFESLSGDTVIGSGLTQSREEQMAGLVRNAVREIEGWLAENRAWFDPAFPPPPRFVPVGQGTGPGVGPAPVAPVLAAGN